MNFISERTMCCFKKPPASSLTMSRKLKTGFVYDMLWVLSRFVHLAVCFHSDLIEIDRD
jgi:hypothetical protein